MYIYDIRNLRVNAILVCKFMKKNGFDILDNRVSVHHDSIYENDQQDTTVWDNLLFLGCATCFEQYFRSSSGTSKLYHSFWYYTRMSLLAGIMGVLEQSSNTPMKEGIINYRTQFHLVGQFRILRSDFVYTETKLRSCWKLRNIGPYNPDHDQYSNGDARYCCCLAILAGSERKGNLNIPVFGIWLRLW